MEVLKENILDKDNMYIKQIMLDMKNGVMAVDERGKILYANPQMTQFFEKENMQNETIHSLMYESDNSANDAFWDVMLNVVHGREVHHQEKVEYTSPSGRKYNFHAVGSYLRGGIEGVAIVLADETKYETLVRKKRDTAIFLIGILLLVCLTVMVEQLYVFLNGAFPHDWIARSTEITSLIFMIYLLKRTSLTVKEMGVFPVKIKKELVESLGTAVAMVLIMSIAKVVLLRNGSSLFASGTPFFDFTAPPDFYYLKYIAIVLVQEFMTKCGLQQNFRLLLDGKHKEAISIGVTAVMFMALHLQHGLIYMLGAGILSLVLAVLYSRHNSLLGCGIVHYTFGIMGLVLGWIH